MNIAEFFVKVEQHNDLEGLAVVTKSESPYCKVGFIPTDIGTRLPLEAIEKADWKTLEDLLTGKREPVALQHMTRVVGYFSRIDNWNKSKLGELKDRQNGDYRIK